MHYLPTLLFVIFALCTETITAQNNDRSVWQDYLPEVINTEDYDTEEMEEVYEHLAELEAQPLNINDATYEDMCRIPGLTIDIISDIMLYRDKYGALKTMEELSQIPSIDRTMRLFLSNFFVAKPSELDHHNKDSKWYRQWWRGERLDSIMKHGKGTVLATGSIPFYRRAGVGNTYLGDRYKYSIKVKGNFSDYIKYGFIGAKDAGEPFLSGQNKDGFDSYSFFLNINKVGRIKSLMIGRYKLRMGQGLILNNGFALGKQFMLSSLSASNGRSSLSGHASRSDSKFLQGLAATFDLSHLFSHTTSRSSSGTTSGLTSATPYYINNPYDKSWKVELTVFWSYRKMDATLNDNGSVATLLTSGYHRTATEMAKKNNTSVLMTGGNLSMRKGSWHFGLSAVYDWLNRPLSPSSADMYKYYPRGNSFWNASVDYGYTSHLLTISGETATGSCGNIATINTALLRLRNQLQITAVQRFYSYDYYALAAKSFSDGGYVQNESGFFLGARYPLSGNITLDAYSDIAYFPWAKYLTLPGSYSWDNTMSLTFSKGKWTAQGRYRYHLRQRQNEAKTANVNRNDHSLRLSVTRASEMLTLKTEADYHFLGKEGSKSYGWMIAQTATIKAWKHISLSLMGSYFDTDDYDTRMYLYERGMQDSFSYASVYGNGFRVSAVARADISKSWMLMLKIGHTKYFDRSEISSGNQLISHSYQTDLDLQVRVRF